MWLFPINEYSHRVYLLTEFFERRRGEWDQKKPVSVTVCDTIEEALLIGSAPLPLLVGYSRHFQPEAERLQIYGPPPTDRIKWYGSPVADDFVDENHLPDEFRGARRGRR